MPTAQFYDGPADTYHALNPDWRSAGRAQAQALHRLRRPPAPRTIERRTTAYRAYTRAGLTALASAAGLRDIRWPMPRGSGFFQPVMTARSPA